MVKTPPARAGDARDASSIPGLGRSLGVGRSPWSTKWPPVFLPGKFHGQRNLTGYSPWDRRIEHDRGGIYTHTHTRNVLKTAL